MLRLCTILLSLLPASLPVGGLDIVKPEPFVFGSPVAEVRERLEPLCASLRVRVTAPPTAPLAGTGPQRNDCDGFLQVGRPREVELLFQDNRLDLVWIVFPAQEKQAFLEAFTARYGAPSLQLEFGRVYLAAGAAVRSVPGQEVFASSLPAGAVTPLKAQDAGAAPSTPRPPPKGDTP